MDKKVNLWLNIIFLLVILLLLTIILSVLIVNWNIFSFSHSLNPTDAEAAKVVGEFKSIVNDYIIINITLMAVFIAISTIIPIVSVRHISDKKLDSLVTEKIDDYYLDHHNVKLLSLVAELKVANADHSRMAAHTLYSFNKYFWSMGWLARSIYLYSIAQEIDKNKYDNIMGSCYPFLVKIIADAAHEIFKGTQGATSNIEKFITTAKSDNEVESFKEIFSRTLASLIDQEIAGTLRKEHFSVPQQHAETVKIFIALCIYILSFKNGNIDKTIVPIVVSKNSSYRNKDILTSKINTYMEYIGSNYEFAQTVNVLKQMRNGYN